MRAWASVSTPHTFNDVDTYSHLTKSEADGEKAMWTGKTWYRKHFTVPADLANRKVFVEFEGVRQRGRVYINGVDVGMSESGFVPFGFDLTPNVKFGQDNVLAVVCDNTFPMNAEGSSDRSRVARFALAPELRRHLPQRVPPRDGQDARRRCRSTRT